MFPSGGKKIKYSLPCAANGLGTAGWPPVQSQPVVTGARKRRVSWRHTEFNPYSAEAVGRQGVVQTSSILLIFSFLS